MRVMNTVSNSHSENTPEKCLQEAEQAQKNMYLETCLQERQQLSSFVASVDGLIGVEATATLERMASRLATKWRQPYLRTCEYIKSRVAITLVRATYQCIRWYRVPAQKIGVQRLKWEDSARIKLFR